MSLLPENNTSNALVHDVTDSEEDSLEGAKRARHRRKAILGFSFMILLFILGCVFHHQVAFVLHEFLNACSKLGWIAVAAVCFLTAAAVLCMMPCFPLMLGAGILFPRMYGAAWGPVIGTASVFGGMWIGSMGAFQLGRSCSKQWAEEELNDMAWMKVINQMVQEQGWWMVLLARMSPILPAEVFNYACAVTDIPTWEYGVGCLGSVVPVGIWVYSTAAAHSLVSSGEGDSEEAKAASWRRQLIVVMTNVVVLALLSCGLYLAVRNYRQKARESEDTDAEARGVELDKQEESELQGTMCSRLFMNGTTSESERSLSDSSFSK